MYENGQWTIVNEQYINIYDNMALEILMKRSKFLFIIRMLCSLKIIRNGIHKGFLKYSEQENKDIKRITRIIKIVSDPGPRQLYILGRF